MILCIKLVLDSFSINSRSCLFYFSEFLMIEEHHNCSTGNGRTSGCCFDWVVELTLFSSLCVIRSNYKHFNLLIAVTNSGIWN